MKGSRKLENTGAIWALIFTLTVILTEPSAVAQSLQKPATGEEIAHSESSAALRKIELSKLFAEKGIRYFGPSGSFRHSLQFKVTDKIIYALFLKDFEGQNWEQNWNFFANHLNHRSFSILAVVDCDFGDWVCMTIEKTVIRQYYRARLISSDVYQDLHNLSDKNEDDDGPLFVSAIGRSFKLGALYNASADQFIGRSLFKKGATLNTTFIDLGNETVAVIPNTLRAKMEALNVQPMARRLQVLLNPDDFPNSGRTFLERSGYTPNSVSRTLVHTFNSRVESTPDPASNSFFQSTDQSIDPNGLFHHSSVPTHFVHRIIYGGITTISLTKSLRPQDNRTYVTAFMEKLLKNVGQYSGFSTSSLDPKALASYESVRLNYKIEWASDIYEAPTRQFGSFREMMLFANNFKTYKSRKNGGIGEPVMYVLYPLKNLQKFIGVIPEPRPLGRVVTDDIAKGYVDIFDDFYRAQGKAQMGQGNGVKGRGDLLAPSSNTTPLDEVTGDLNTLLDLATNYTELLRELEDKNVEVEMTENILADSKAALKAYRDRAKLDESSTVLVNKTRCFLSRGKELESIPPLPTNVSDDLGPKIKSDSPLPANSSGALVTFSGVVVGMSVYVHLCILNMWWYS